MDFMFKDENESLSTGGGGFVSEPGLYPCVVDSVVFIDGVKDNYSSNKTIAVVCATTTSGQSLSFNLEVARDGKSTGSYQGRSYLLAGYKQLGQMTKLSGVRGFSSQGAPKASGRVLDLVDEHYSFIEREGLLWAQIAGAKLYFLFNADKKGYLSLQKVFSDRCKDIDDSTLINAPYMDKSKNKGFNVTVGARLRKFIDAGSEGANPDFSKGSSSVANDGWEFLEESQPVEGAAQGVPVDDDGVDLPF